MDTTNQQPAKRDAERTRRRILAAAAEHFATLGLSGARTDAIAESSGVNERNIFHHFRNKERLYATVLESAYAEFAAEEGALDLSGLEPADAVRKFARSIWTHLRNSPHWLALVNDANFHCGQHLLQSENLRATISPVLEMLTSVLEDGVDKGQFREDIDPLDFYITLVGMGAYIVSNRFTLTAFTGRDYAEQGNHDALSSMQLDMLLAYLCAPNVESPMTDRVRREAQTLEEQEAVARAMVAAAQRALEHSLSEEGTRRSQAELAEAGQALGMIQAAITHAKPYRGPVFQCTACRNLFSNEGSYLAHWQPVSGSTRCISTLSKLREMGFIVERPQPKAGSGPEYVLGLPSLSEIQ